MFGVFLFWHSFHFLAFAFDRSFFAFKLKLNRISAPSIMLFDKSIRKNLNKPFQSWGRMHENTKKTICVLVTATLSLTQLHSHLKNKVYFCICLSFVASKAKRKRRGKTALQLLRSVIEEKKTFRPGSYSANRSIETSTTYSILCATSITNNIHWLRIYFQFVCC